MFMEYPRKKILFCFIRVGILDFNLKRVLGVGLLNRLIAESAKRISKISVLD
jgi:hypothetical protein